MARKRMIDPAIWTSEQVNNLPRDARLLFIGLFSNADDEGRIKGSPRYLKATIFPYDNIDPNDIQAWLDQIAEQQLVSRYNVNGDEYIVVPNFLKHQKISHPSQSKLPAPVFREDSRNPHGGLTEDSSLIKVNLDKDNLITPKGVRRKAPSAQKDPVVKNIFAEMRGYLGYPSDFRGEADSSAAEGASAGETKKVIDPIPNYGKEGRAIKRMLTRGFTREAIVECWKSKVSQRGGEFISMTWVNEDIGRSSQQRRSPRRLSSDEEIAGSIKEARTWHGDK